MTLNDLLALLSSRGVRLRLEEDRLRYVAPPGAITDEIRAGVARWRTDLESALRVAPSLERGPAVGSRGGDVALSFAQQRLWFLDQLHGPGAAYNMPGAVSLSGALDVGVLERCLNEVVRRHEVLRTRYVVRDGGPVQVIEPAEPVSVPVRDLSGLPSEQREAAARGLAEEEARRPFDLAAGPVIRFLLLRLDVDRHVFVWNMHHIASDGWSLGVFYRELSTLYAAFTAGEDSPLPELAVQYADFAAWQRRWLTGDVLESHLAYWRTQLADAPALLELPTDRPRPPVQSFRGSSEQFVVDPAVRRGLQDLSQRAGVTLFMTLEAALVTVLARHSGQTDIVVGTPIANRTHATTEPLIGYFSTTTVLRSNLASDPTYRFYSKSWGCPAI